MGAPLRGYARSMNLGIEGKVAVITGVSRGIGWSTARLLIEEGAHVVGVSRSALERELDGLVHMRADLMEETTPARAIALALSQFGSVDILVNNAGSGPVREGYAGLGAATWRETWEMVFLAAVRMVDAALPALLESEAAAIVNVSSINARTPVAEVPDYSAAKAALNSYSKGLAVEYAGAGLRVVTVSPGPTATPLWLGPEGAAAQVAAREGSDPDAVVRETEAAMPHGRLIKPEEVADLIVYLASARAGSVNGIDVLIDAGLTKTL
jgi:NAD(P)-dependent dehydrogenase (short-subunit alcohol dehydrogenase family)